MATATKGFVLLDTFVPEILQYVQGCPTIMARTHIRNTIIMFCERSRILKRNPSSFFLTEDVSKYTLKYSGDRYVAIASKECQIGEGQNGTKLEEVTEHELDNSVHNWREQTASEPTSYFLTDEINEIRFYATPDTDSEDEVFVKTIVKPRRNVTEVDEFLWEKWEETIQAGALASLLIMPGATWQDTALATTMSNIFRRDVRRARATSVSGTTEKPTQVVPRSFEVFGSDYSNRRTTTWE